MAGAQVRTASDIRSSELVNGSRFGTAHNRIDENQPVVSTHVIENTQAGCPNFDYVHILDGGL